MSKLAERIPALVDTATKLSLVDGVIEDAADEDGRIEVSKLVEVVEAEVANLEVRQERLIKEGQRRAAEEVVSAWTNSRVIRLNRDQRVPVYQLRFGFAGSYFKVGSVLVPPAEMKIADFELMLERQERRIENAQTDHSIWRDFYALARPGLEAGQNLVDQFDAGTLSLGAATGVPALEEGEETE